MENHFISNQDILSGNSNQEIGCNINDKLCFNYYRSFSHQESRTELIEVGIIKNKKTPPRRGDVGPEMLSPGLLL